MSKPTNYPSFFNYSCQATFLSRRLVNYSNTTSLLLTTNTSSGKIQQYSNASATNTLTAIEVFIVECFKGSSKRYYITNQFSNLCFVRYIIISIIINNLLLQVNKCKVYYIIYYIIINKLLPILPSSPSRQLFHDEVSKGWQSVVFRRALQKVRNAIKLINISCILPKISHLHSIKWLQT